MPNYIEKIDKRNLPVVPLRGIVVFPQNLSSLELTGDTALAALDAASKSDGVAFFVLQKDYSVENPKTDNLNEMGTVAKIKQTIKTNDKARRVILEGINRAVISSAEKKRRAHKRRGADKMDAVGRQRRTARRGVYARGGRRV